MKEAQIQTRLTRYLNTEEGMDWLRDFGCTGIAIELKVDHGKGRIAHSQIAEHQIMALERAEQGLLAHKISDSAVGFKPCDMMCVLGGVGLFVFGFEGVGMWAVRVGDVKKKRSSGRGSFSIEWVKDKGVKLDLTL